MTQARIRSRSRCLVFLAREAGADAVLFYREEDFCNAARKLTNGLGVNVGVHSEIPMGDVQKAYRRLEGRETMGNVLLIP